MIPEPSKTGVVAIKLDLVLTNENRSLDYVIEWENNIDGMSEWYSSIIVLYIKYILTLFMLIKKVHTLMRIQWKRQLLLTQFKIIQSSIVSVR